MASPFQPVTPTGGPMATDPHTRIHQGVMYRCGYIAASVADAGNIDVVLTTPALDYPHVVFQPEFDGSADIFIYEAPAFTGGTSLTTPNLNRNSINTFSGTAKHTPTVSNTGTELLACHVAGGTGPHAAGAGGAGFDFEWVLKESTSYLFRLTNRSGQAQRGSICLYFYSAGLIR